MRLCFAGFGGAVELNAEAVSTLEINSRVLFSRTCSSLLSEQGRYATEPYSLWLGEDELNPRGQLLFAANPLDLPWDDKSLAGGVSARVEALLYEDEGLRCELEGLSRSLESAVTRLTLQMGSSYSFALNWELKRYLRSFAFGVDLTSDDSLFDRLIKFLLLAEDVSLKRVLVFVNLKLFLSEKELEQVMNQVIFSGLSVLLLENTPDKARHELERKYIIDQDLLETWPSSSQ